MIGFIVLGCYYIICFVVGCFLGNIVSKLFEGKNISCKNRSDIEALLAIATIIVIVLGGMLFSKSTDSFDDSMAQVDRIIMQIEMSE